MQEKSLNPIKLFFLCLIALLFLAANSLLCKAALKEFYIDAYSFTFVRLLSGALVLVFIVNLKHKSFSIDLKRGWLSAFMLFLYALPFSYAYLSLNAGLGALILFALVQLTIILYAVIKKEYITIKKLFGITLAFVGLIYLLFPKEDFSISVFHFLLMALSGFAWGIYTILGRKSSNPLKDTSENFIKTIPFLFLFFIFVEDINISLDGVFFASISGGITSALGYALWYYVIKHLKIITTSTIQLLVPIIAIFLSIILLHEPLSSSLLISTLLILTGILLSIQKS